MAQVLVASLILSVEGYIIKMTISKWRNTPQSTNYRLNAFLQARLCKSRSSVKTVTVTNGDSWKPRSRASFESALGSIAHQASNKMIEPLKERRRKNHVFTLIRVFRLEVVNCPISPQLLLSTKSMPQYVLLIGPVYRLSKASNDLSLSINEKLCEVPFNGF